MSSKEKEVSSAEQQKKEALAALDSAGWSSSHTRAVLVAGTGFLTDSYDNFVIGLMVPMMAYGLGLPKGKFPGYWDTSFLKAASAWGNLFGQLGFGILGDVIGRKKMYGVELIILMVGAFGCAQTAAPGYGLTFLSIMCFWRFLLGVGVGGDYPVSSVITAEFAGSRMRGTMMALVFSMQGVGTILGTVVSIVTLSAYKDQIEANSKALDMVWRWMALFGLVPCLMAVYYRLTISETPRYTLEVEGNAEQAIADAKQFIEGGKLVEGIAAAMPEDKKPYWTEFKQYFGQWKNFKVILGCAMCWFLVDIGFYGTNLNTKAVLDAIGYVDPHASPFDDNWKTAVGQLIINLCGYVPGYLFSIALIDRVGRKPIQLLGFVVLTTCFAVLAASFDQSAVKAGKLNPTSLSNPAFIAIYCCAQFFFNFGPNTTTFILPAEVFPTRFRSAAHGICAACGKLGAILALQFFQIVADHEDPFNPKSSDKANINFGTTLWIFAATCALGIPFTFLVPETKGKTLEEIHEERDAL
ncbi:phosphate transporter [Globomyces sp. JEL0801]|nr:phosphate transporter [Globomyces sp. JEL0801]